ncbi:hypothetical protein Syun_012477 [Stephania yunnanensis]|uniref:Uncharacterized protein n=1 Tax=Stephania yunnanensis TaxID=152371 RepID=A0AAP0PGF6_9MAGN
MSIVTPHAANPTSTPPLLAKITSKKSFDETGFTGGLNYYRAIIEGPEFKELVPMLLKNDDRQEPMEILRRPMEIRKR